MRSKTPRPLGNAGNKGKQDTDPWSRAGHMPTATYSSYSCKGQPNYDLRLSDGNSKNGSVLLESKGRESEKEEGPRKASKLPGKNKIHLEKRKEPSHEKNEPPKHDRIAEGIKHEIDRFAVQSVEKFQDFYNKVHVYPAKHALSAYDEEGEWAGYTRYIFDTYGEEARDMQVRVDWQQLTLWVGHSGVWIILEEFLSRLPPPVNIRDAPKEHLSSEDKNKLWQDQWAWWRKNRNTFRLLDLPSEIREKILGFAVVRTIRPYLNHRCRKLSTRHKNALASEQPNMALLRTNRQVYREGRHLLFRDSVFLIEHFKIFKDYIMFKKASRNHIMRLDLKFKHKGFFLPFGIMVKDHGIEYLPSQAARLLRGMKLKQLTLSIAMTDTPMLSPFGRHEWHKPCQKIAVDWILECAWPWMKGHPVTVQGGVKTRQKENFMKKVTDERERYLKWRRTMLLGDEEGTLTEYYEWLDEKGGEPIDGQESHDDVELVPEKQNLPPCSCTPPCYEKWTPED
ncbi:hypothetical protein M409DRAFT_17399 [Zasmidium cellare ATCC 36951]|uniref:F-box domain-containing protein n=1 Tax=Zasmidium cellare ATCC 36951 TaxID=1080233 RepID=A0A6A6D239_ZASCE|nr:uncharacterized protein M409DRAFT_17399 [Zasmidium cellare ATCC 36951]KAF2172159.1 hypothetical protein M409DRAFT_17399 [Zasmidium cellare ATCC 36951]